MSVTLTQVYKGDSSQDREWPVASGTNAGTAVVSISNQPAVTITNRGDSTLTKQIGYISITIPSGGVGNLPGSATIAVNGTYRGAVTGAGSSTPKNTSVFAVVAGGLVTELTLTAAGNTKFGVVDSFLGKASASDTAIKIGVFA
ncbi:hypothetical protein [Frigoribacterium sp. UYMn621]|uniref:hypothetical protein n=1 Tax=Frigoribacterium sp. UYMn621 TaxID=3156343 RepID=UPI00339108EE